jgi:hypothetical protein
MIGITRIDYAAAARQREEWRAWLQAKAAERRLSDPHGSLAVERKG